MELFQSNTSTKTSAPIRLENHILQQFIINRVLLELTRNAPEVIK